MSGAEKIASAIAGSALGGIAKEAMQSSLEVAPAPKSYVVHGALVQCSCGSRPALLIVPISHGVYLKQKAQLIRRDGVGMVNIQSMGVCSAQSVSINLDRAEKKKKGFLQTVKDIFTFKKSKTDEEIAELAKNAVVECVPSTNGRWINTKSDTFIGEGFFKNALMSDSHITCLKGGTITIVFDGQEDIDYNSVFFPPEEEEIIEEEVTEEANEEQGLLDNILDVGGGLLSGAFNFVDDALTLGSNAIEYGVEAICNPLDTLGNVVDAVTNPLETYENIKDTVVDGFSGHIEKQKAVVDDIVKNTKEIKENVKEISSDVQQKAVNTYSNLKETANEVHSNIKEDWNSRV